jgi:uncharacterized NAD(P)/FAD-binding protein YdhS
MVFAPAMQKTAPETGLSEAYDVVVIGGGFSGASFLLHLVRHLGGRGSIAIIEPREDLGRGVAYSTSDPAHRINTFASRMTVFPDDRLHFDRWVRESGAVEGDPAAMLPDGRMVPQRAVFGTYVGQQLRHAIEVSGVRVDHIRSQASAMMAVHDGWHVLTEGGRVLSASSAVIAASHQPPEIPQSLEPAAADPRFISDPWRETALAAVHPQDDVIIVGTGLTMADIVASLDGRGHRGRIHAISRRGLLSRGQSESERIQFGDFAESPSRTARQLVRRIRTTLREADRAGLGWHPVFHAVGRDATPIWAALDNAERVRLLRHLRPYWDVHRFRIAPQVEGAVRRGLQSGRLSVTAASILGAEMGERIKLDLRLRRSGKFAIAGGDKIILATGVGQNRVFETSALLQGLKESGRARPDSLRLGIDVNARSQALRANGEPNENLYVAGPLARAFFGELMGANQILNHAHDLARSIASRIS